MKKMGKNLNNEIALHNDERLVRIFLTHGTLGYKSLRIIATTVATLLIFSQIIHFSYSGSDNFFLSFSSIIMLIMALGLLIYSVFLLAPSRAPRIELTENLIILKNSVFTKSVTFGWEEINTIQYRPHHISFILSTGSEHEIHIDTDNVQIARKITFFIRKVAQQKKFVRDI